MDIFPLSIFPLELFPQGALSSSVITTAWIGVFVVCFFNMRFGWVLSGLIIPGYLVPLLLIKPWSAGITIFEGVITYLIVWFFSEKLSGPGRWSSLFGRDRFFALIVCSVLVRVVFDAYLLPDLGHYLNQEYALNFDYQSNLHSFGLIIVSLIANQFWKTGLLKGIGPFLVILTTSYLLVRYGLMELTNFTLSNLNYIYEDIASSILASPKAYIILLSAAFIASRMNLRYGWDFNGILIPALLALQWYEPLKILTSFLEAFIILLFAHVLLKMPLFANMNMEGARKILLFFNIGFFYKLLLGHYLLWNFPEVKVSDAYGFGYLLSTLIAVKMHDKEIAVRFTRSTVQISLVAIVVSSLIGFLLTLSYPLLKSQLTARTEQAMQVFRIEDTDKSTLLEQIRDDKVSLYQSRSLQQLPAPLVSELEQFAQSLKLIQHYIKNKDEKKLQQAINKLETIGFGVSFLEQRYLYIKEKNQLRGWGIYVIDTITENNLLIEIPFPLDERGTLEAGVSLMTQMSAFSLASAGSTRNANRDGSANVLQNRQTIFHIFHKIMSKRDVLQIRSKRPEFELINSLSGDGSAGVNENEQKNQNKLLIKKTIPPGLDLKLLKELLNNYSLLWKRPNETNYQFEDSFNGMAELDLSPKALRQLVVSQFHKEQSLTVQREQRRIDGYLQQWLFSQEDIIAKSGTNHYQIPGNDELLFFDEEIISPLIKIIERYNRLQHWSKPLLESLNIIMGYATTFNYTLIQYQHQKSGENFLILREMQDVEHKRYWGTYVFRLGEATPFMIEIPRPLYEVNSFEYAVSLFEQLKARYLLIAGTHPYSNVDGSSDLVRLDNQASLFTLVNQIVMREFGNRPLYTFSIRAFGFRDDVGLPEEDILISLNYNQYEVNDPTLLKLVSNMDDNGISYQFVDGDIKTAGYEVGSLPQSLYAEMSENKVFGILWLSPYLRQSYKQKDNTRYEINQFNTLAIETIDVDLSLLLSRLYNNKKILLTESETAYNIPDKLKILLKKYIVSQDILVLYKILSNWPEYTFQRVIDFDSRQSFLLLFDKQNRLVKLGNLSPRDINTISRITHVNEVKDKVSQFITARTAWLQFQNSRETF